MAALPLKELLSFTTAEMLAFKRRGWLPSIAETIAEVILEGDRGPMATKFEGTIHVTTSDTLTEAITRILSNWGPEGRAKIEALVTARKKSLVHFLSNAIEAEEFAEFQWLSDRLVAIE
jgi:hypothetical protein